MELKKIGVLSLGKIAGIIGVIYGLIAGILFAIIYSKASEIQGLTQQFGMIANLGYSVILVLPVIYGIAHFIGGVIIAFVYNLIAEWIGGIELEFSKTEKKKK